MELLKTKKVIVGKLEFIIRYSNRASLSYYNSIAKDPDNYDAMVRYLYDLSKAGATAEGVEFNYTLEEFDAVIDPIPNAIIIFKEAVAELFSAGGDEKK